MESTFSWVQCAIIALYYYTPAFQLLAYLTQSKPGAWGLQDNVRSHQIISRLRTDIKHYEEWTVVLSIYIFGVHNKHSKGLDTCGAYSAFCM